MGIERKEVKYKSTKEIVALLEKGGIIGKYDQKVRAYTLKPLADSEVTAYIKKICPYMYTINPRGFRLSKYYGKELWAYQAKSPLIPAPRIHLFNGRNQVLPKLKTLVNGEERKPVQYAYLEIINEE